MRPSLSNSKTSHVQIPPSATCSFAVQCKKENYSCDNGFSSVRPSVRPAHGIMRVVSPGVTHSHAREIQCQGGEEIRIPCLLLGSVTRIGLAAIEPPFCLREKAKPKAQKKSKCGTKSDTSIYISRPGTFLHITWILKERAMTVRCSRSEVRPQ